MSERKDLTRREFMKVVGSLAAIAATGSPEIGRANPNCVEYTKAMDRADKRTSIKTGPYASSKAPQYDKRVIEFTPERDYADKRTGVAA